MTRKSRRRRSRQARILAAKGGSLKPISFMGSVDIQAAEGESEGPPKFVATIYNGGPLRVSGYDLPVVVDLAGVTEDPGMVANMDHDETKRVGHVTDTINDGSSLVQQGLVSAASPEASQVAASATNGFPWKTSLEADPLTKPERIKAGESVTVNGQTISGPVYVARQTKLYGFAFLNRAADTSTSVSIAAAAKVEVEDELRTFISAAGFDADDLDEPRVDFFRKQMALKAQATRKKTPTTVAEITAASRARKEHEEQIAAIAATAIDDAPDTQSVDTITAMAQRAIETEQDPVQFENDLLRSTRPQARPRFTSSSESPKHSAAVLEAAVCRIGGLPNLEKEFNEATLEASEKYYRNGIGLAELFIIAARNNGFRDHTMTVTKDVLKAGFAEPNEIRASSGFSTLSLPGILSNIANKFLRRGFNSVEAEWSRCSASRSVRDFKEITTYSLVGDYEFQKLGPTGEIKHGVPGETTYTNQAETYARMLGITRTDFINDDLGALTDVPMKLGRGAGLRVNKVFWGEFLDNATFFTAGNNNLLTGAGSALDDTGSALNDAEVAFRKQTDPDDNPLGVAPRIMVVPVDLHNTALRVMNSSLLIGQGADAAPSVNANVFNGRYEVVSSNYLTDANLTGNSATAWYLLADPMDLPVIEICWLNGVMTPTVEQAEADFNQLGVQMRGYNDFGVRKQEYRGGVKSAGA